MKAKTLLFTQIAIIVAVGCWIYAPAFHGEWLWDDSTSISENSLMRDPAALWKIWFAPTSLDYYPMQASVEWIQWQLWGMNTLGYHLTNVGLQLLDALLFWHVLRQLGLRLAWLGGLLLVVHPMMVESVAWIVELKNTLSLAFLLLAMIAWVDWDRASDPKVAPRQVGASSTTAGGTPALLCYALSLLCFLAAMLTKSSVVMFPVVLLLYAWWQRGRIARKEAIATAPFFAVSLALGLVTIWLQVHRAIGALAAPHVGGIFSRAAVAGLAAAFYLWKFVAPVGLMPIYPHWDVDPPSAVQFLPWLAIGGLIWLLWKTRQRGALFGLGFFLINLAPVSSVVTGSYMRLTWVMDHLAYVSLLGLIGLAVAGADRVLGVAQASPPASSTMAGGTPALLRKAPSRVVAWALVSVLVASLAIGSHRYARAFSSGRAFWSLAVERNPAAWAAHYNLALILIEAGQFPEAIAHLRTAVRLNPDYTEAHNNLANALCQTGRYAEAIPHFEQALRLDPTNAVIHYNFGLALHALGYPDEARAQWLEAARLNAR